MNTTRYSRRAVASLAFASAALASAALAGCGQPTPLDPAPNLTLVKSIREAKVETAGGGAESGPVASDKWASLSGRFTFDGAAPALRGIIPDKNPEVCGKDAPIPDERLVVDPATRGVANIVVYVTTKANKLAIHPSYEALANAEVLVDNKNCYFRPHVTAVWTRSVLVSTNSDQVGHNLDLAPPGDAVYKAVIGPGQKSSPMTFRRAQNKPIAYSCNMHSWMKGYLLPRDNPYFAVTAADGSFKIENLPADVELEIQFWHEAQAEGLPVPDAKKGKLKIKLPEAGRDLPEIELTADNFNL